MNNKKIFIPFLAILLLLLIITEFVLALGGSVSPTKFILSGEVGKTFQKDIIVRNTNNVPVNVSVSADGSNIVLGETKLSIDAYSNYTLNFNVTINKIGYDERKINFRFREYGGNIFDTYTTLALTGSGTGQSPNQSSGENTAKKLEAHVAYVVKDTANPDPNLINIMNELGYSYKLIRGIDAAKTNFSDYAMILLGDERIYNVPVNNYKSLIANPDYYSGWSGSKSSTTRRNVYNVNQKISITEGLNKNFLAYTQSSSLYYLTGAKYNTKSVSTTGNSTVDLGRFVVAYKENPRRIFFGITKTNYWTGESRQLFKNSMQWILEGQDIDGDGYYTDSDCNDNNPNLWKNIPGYADFDKDGFGAGSLVNVCSGASLLEGYSLIDGDCNNLEISINPDATEIPYDGIDNNCDGFDLKDVDKDGYNYPEDCNDNDNRINPNAVEIMDNIDQNCKNDAPILAKNIPDLEWNEDQAYRGRIDLKDYFKDYDGDTLNFSVYNFSEENIIVEINNGILSLSSDKNWNGDAELIIKADDNEEYALSNGISLKINSVNDKPEIKNKNDLITNLSEDFGEYEFSLSPFKNDVDNDPEDLGWSINNFNGPFNASIYGDILKITSMNNAFCSENCGIILRLSDVGNKYDEAYFKVIINPVNDAPLLIKDIENITWNEDIKFVNGIDLNDYFQDIDNSLLQYSVSGNSIINITIDNDLVSFEAPKDWFGNETVVFKASDGEFNVDSNEVNIEILAMDEPPEFGEINCAKDILEDNLYSCELSASDLENDPVNFSVAGRNNLNCTIDGNVLNYASYKDYFGNASCLLRANDKDGYDEYLFETKIENTNDAPNFVSYSPEKDTKILNNTSKEFRIIARDIDSNSTNISWVLDNEVVGNGSSYLFNKTFGWYNLSAIASDGELSSINLWNVYVGLMNDFKCSEVSGHLCSGNQMCKGSLLKVYDSQSCCSIQCVDGPPVFNSIKREPNITNSIGLEINRPDSLNEFHTGDKIPIGLRIVNNKDKNINFDVYAYLYDSTKQDVVERASNSFSLNKGIAKSDNLEIQIPEKIKESNEYYIFAKVVGKYKKELYYNEKYVKIKILRNQDDVKIENVLIEPENLLCGDSAIVKIKIRNYGLNTEEVYIKVEGSALGINKKSDTFTLEDYDSSDDSIEREFKIDIPENKDAGNYTIKASAFFKNETDSMESKIVLGECKMQKIETNPVGTNFESIKLEAKTIKPLLSQREAIVMISTTLMLIIFMLVLIMSKIYNKNLTLERSRKMIKQMIKKKRRK